MQIAAIPFDTETMMALRHHASSSIRSCHISRSLVMKAGRSSPAAIRRHYRRVDSGFYIQPTLIKGHNEMRSFRIEIFCPVIGVTTLRTRRRRWRSQTRRSLFRAAWTRIITAYRMGRGIRPDECGPTAITFTGACCVWRL